MLFDRLAERYDQVIPFFAEFAGHLLDVLDPEPGTRLLDIGSGRGAIAADHPGIDVRLMDAHRLDLPAASYDLATGGFVIHLVREPLRVLAGLRRVLRPGASVALAVPGPCEDHGRWDAWNTLVERFTARAERPPRRDYGVASHLHAAGFADIRTVNLAVHLPVPGPQTCWDFHMSHGFSAVVEALDEADAAEFQRAALAELTRMHDSGGITLDRGAVVHLATVPADDQPHA